MSANAFAMPDVAVGAESQTAQARRVDHHAATGQRHQLAGRGRVPAAGVLVADGGGGEPLLTEQRVDERRLAGTRRAEHHRGAIGREEPRHRVDASVVPRRRLQHVDPDEAVGERGHERLRVEVRLGDQHHGLRAGIPREHGLALDPLDARTVGRARDQHEVDVRREHLEPVQVRVHAGERRPPLGDHRHRGRVGAHLDAHPVADRRERLRHRHHPTIRGHDATGGAGDAGDASRDEPVEPLREQCLDPSVPTERDERRPVETHTRGRPADDRERQTGRDDLVTSSREVGIEAQLHSGVLVGGDQVAHRPHRQRADGEIGHPLPLGLGHAENGSGANEYSKSSVERIATSEPAPTKCNRGPVPAQVRSRRARCSTSWAQTATRAQSRGNQ